MATYNPKQLLNDYANGRMTPEIAVGHSLQHINLLYETQTSANAERSALRLELNQLQAAFHRLQQAVEDLHASIDIFRNGLKSRGATGQLV